MKLIVADLDGTIVHKKVIKDQTKETIKRLRDEGHLFTIATGRHILSAIPVVEELGIEGPIITNNGAVVLNPHSNTILSEETLSKAVIDQAVEFSVELGVHFVMYTKNEIVGTDLSVSMLKKIIGDFDSRIITLSDLRSLRKDVIKILFIEYDMQKYESLENKMRNIDSCNVVRSNEGFLDVVSDKASKGDALRVLCEYHNLTLNDCITFGDNENDLSMIELAKTGVAMGNAIDKVKDVADFVTKTYQENGFSYGVNKLVFDDLLFDLNNEYVFVEDCNTIEEALSIAAKPLIESHINQGYLDRVKEVIQKEDYFVLLKEIAFLHVNPSYGSTEVGFSVVKLRKKVKLLEKDVSVVILLSGKDDIHHLKLLKRLSLKLKNNNDELLRVSKTKEEIIDLLK